MLTGAAAVSFVLTFCVFLVGLSLAVEGVTGVKRDIIFFIAEMERSRRADHDGPKRFSIFRMALTFPEGKTKLRV